MKNSKRDQPTASKPLPPREEDADEDKRLPLNQAQSRTLAEVLLSPKNPNKKLKLAMADYRQRVESR